MADLDDLELIEPAPKERSDAPTSALVRSGVVGVVLLALLSFAGATNPWQLVVLDDHRLALLFACSISTMAALVIAVRRVRRPWLRQTATALACLAGLYALLVAFAAVAVPLLTPFTSVESEETIRIADGLSVHRTKWNSGALHSCVELHVRTGDGWSSRFGPTTVCADTENPNDWLVSAVGDMVVVTRWNDETCTYWIDVAERRLRPVAIDDCEALGVID